MGILAVNLMTGETDSQVVFDEKEPDYTVDPIGGRLYFFPGKKNIAAYDLYWLFEVFNG